MSSFLSHRGPQVSPSITMEKEAHRVRGGALVRNPEHFTFPSNTRVYDVSDPEPTAQTGSQGRSASLIWQEKRLVLLVISLLFSTSCCFGTAYYLFTASRWVTVSSRTSVAPWPNADQLF